MRVLDSSVPYSVLPGNHDMTTGDKQDATATLQYNKYFGPARYQGQPWYGGHLGEHNDNNYCFFEGAGIKFMVISLEYAPTDLDIQWAGQIVNKYHNCRVILGTHCYMQTHRRDTICGGGGGATGNSGEQIWDRFVRKHANIFMVVSGHVDGVVNQSSVNDFGGKVVEILANYQCLDNGGDGWLRTLRFVPSENKIYCEAYSPVLKQYKKDLGESFVLDFDMNCAVQKKEP